MRQQPLDSAKCRALKAELSSQPASQIIPIEKFFDGNDDPASIGCNLSSHPGIERFREILEGLVNRSDIAAVYARISEVDPGPGCWPFTDTILIVGTISPEELRDVLIELEPDEIGAAEDFGVSPFIGEEHGLPVLAAWWD
jgi:hypothetical protein